MTFWDDDGGKTGIFVVWEGLFSYDQFGVGRLPMKCAICGVTVETIDEAIEKGWTLYFADGGEEHEVACPACTRSLLREGEDGEMKVKEVYRGKLIYLEDESGKEAGKEDVAIEIFFPRENDGSRH
jgi:hypothetical protein